MSATPSIPDGIEATLTWLRETARQLRDLQDTLYEQAMSDLPLPGERCQQLEQLLAMDLLVDLKISTDGLRQTLRTYIDSLQAVGPLNPEACSETARLRHVTEILRVLREQMNAQHSAFGDDGFFAHIDRIITKALQSKPDSEAA